MDEAEWPEVGQKALVVEDSPTQAQEMEMLLETHGFEVEIAPDAEAGLDIAGRRTFDLVLVDVNLPGKSGLDFCREFREDPRGFATLLVLVTSRRDADTALRGLECGADLYFSKPYDMDVLVRVLDRFRVEREEERRRPFKATAAYRFDFAGRRYVLTGDHGRVLDYLSAAFEDLLFERERGEADNLRISSKRPPPTPPLPVPRPGPRS